MGAIRLGFHGAARTVTGACTLLETDGARVLVDCGLSQERERQSSNWEPFPVAPGRIDAVILTHAHLDHCGLLPRLAREGFKGPVFATSPTAEIAQIVMLDSARLQVEDAEAKAQRHAKQGRTGPRPPAPLYTEQDAQRAASLFRPVALGASVGVAPGIEAEFSEAGHILGSASVRATAGTGGGRRAVVFSGDIGRWDKPILNDPQPFDGADYVVMESTYGDRLHGDGAGIRKAFAEVLNATSGAGGNIVIPSFAIERSQEVLYYLNLMLMAHEIPHLLVFLDSPMATRVTDVFRHHPEFFDAEMNRLLADRRSPFDLETLVIARSAEDSKAINHIRGTAVIIAGAGMCTGGSVKHHLAHNISRPESCVLFVGYQAEGTLGRQIQDGAGEVRILGEMQPVRARIATISGFSAHADRDELVRWASSLREAPRAVFVNHGESKVAQGFAAHLAGCKGWKASAPAPRQTVALD